MKKKILCVMFALLLCASLCACGSMRADRGSQTSDLDILPGTTPMISPDRQDGMVTDGDGIIGNGGESSASPMPVPSTNPGSSPSPSPTANTDMSGAASSASPKP